MLCASYLPAQQTLRGRVDDATGAAVADATITLTCAQSTPRTTRSERDGTFAIAVDGKCERGVVSAQAEGFGDASKPLDDLNNLVMVLGPQSFEQSVTVTATRTSAAIAEAPGSSTAISAAEFRNDGALTIDDKLRQVPGFSLFRRSGSQTSNPTAQGVSLRGIGASGASRALVLVDGIPLNDPFGGWVYWGRVPVASIDHVDVVKGGVSDLYGSFAMAGVINLQTVTPTDTQLSFETAVGNERSPFGSGQGSVRRGNWILGASGEGFATDGYFPVPAASRGLIDRKADSEHSSATVSLDHMNSERLREFAQASGFGEDRRNATELQINSATVRQLSAGVDWETAKAGLFNLRAFGGSENLFQTFSSTALNRNSEKLSSVQHVPAQQIGGSALWTKNAGASNRNLLVAGVDVNQITGFDNEFNVAGGYTLHAGGSQATTGIFVEDLIQIASRWQLSLSAREDFWNNYDTVSTRAFLTGKLTGGVLPGRSEPYFSPRIGLSRQIGGNALAYVSLYRSFRTPTLNELYRPFRVGNILTNANSALNAERYSGGEVGGRWATAGDRVRLHGAFFDGYVTGAIANVTLTVTPALITRQRENLGKTLSRGVEAGVEVRVSPALLLGAGYQYVDAKVVTNRATPSLEGNLVPLTPRHSYSALASYSRPRWFTLSLQGIGSSKAYDDDQNLLSLGSYFLLNGTISRPLYRGFEIFAQAENMLDRSYIIQRTPQTQLGAPTLYRIGLRYQMRRR
ncbi:MAG: TonB-dependent receptor [Acidobacteriaceae bacterium]